MDAPRIFAGGLVHWKSNYCVHGILCVSPADEKIPSMKSMLEAKVLPYVERAEALKKVMSKPVAASGTNSCLWL